MHLQGIRSVKANRILTKSFYQIKIIPMLQLLQRPQGMTMNCITILAKIIKIYSPKNFLQRIQFLRIK